MGKRISYKEMMRCNRLDTFIDDKMKKKEIERIESVYKRCKCGNLILGDGDKCRYCEKDG